MKVIVDPEHGGNPSEEVIIERINAPFGELREGIRQCIERLLEQEILRRCGSGISFLSDVRRKRSTSRIKQRRTRARTLQRYKG